MKGLYANLWRWRRLALDLARREVRSRYAGSVLGALWAILEPAVQFGLYLTVFAYLLGTRIEGDPRVGAYAMYLVSGLVPFFAFQETLVRSADFARASASLVKHVSVPLEVLFLGAFLATLARHAVSLGIVGVAGFLAGTWVPAKLPWLLVGAVLLVVMSWGLALLLVVSGAVLPDLSHLVGSGTMVLFFLTPVLYPATLVPAPLARWLPANPLVGALELFRSALIGGRVSPVAVGVTALVAAICLVGGSVVFARQAMAVRDLV
jgi:lipopolysaccharide transport system permease protein